MPVKRRPSLLGALLWTGLGLGFLLQNFNILSDVWLLLARYWPVILILLGLGKIADYFLKKDAVAVGFGELALLMLVFFIGSAATRISNGQLGRIVRNLPIEIGNISIRPGTLIGESHTYTEEAVYPLKSNEPIQIENSYGLVSVAPGSDGEIRVRLRKAVYSEESRAKIIADEIRLETVSEEGTPLRPEQDPKSKQPFVIRTNRDALSAKNYRFAADMEVLVPKNSHLKVKNQFGEIRVAGVNGRLDLSTTHKSIDVRNCSGQFDISARYSECRLTDLVGNLKLEGRGKVYLQNIKGDVSIANEYSPLEIYNVDGKLSISSSENSLTIDGVSSSVVINDRGSDMRVQKLQDSLKIKTSYKTVEIADVASDVTLESRYASLSLRGVKGNVHINSNTDRVQAEDVGGRLTVRARGSAIRASAIRGALDIQTSMKEVLASDFAGACTIANEYGGISVSAQTLGKGNVSLRNRTGGIDLHLPEGAALEIDAIARSGRIESDHPELKFIQTDAGNGKLRARLRTGGPKIYAETENSNIRIFRATGNAQNRRPEEEPSRTAPPQSAISEDAP